MNDDLIQLSKAQLIQITDRGYTYVMVPQGIMRVTKADLVIKREELDRFIEEKKRENEQKSETR